ncbi:MAG TPA: hypothetical protein VI339_03480 [Steroidobacteraceae bacterium]|nr:hypothetical protein [Steroidobacteraceae bacterium]
MPDMIFRQLPAVLDGLGWPVGANAVPGLGAAAKRVLAGGRGARIAAGGGRVNPLSKAA